MERALQTLAARQWIAGLPLLVLGVTGVMNIPRIGEGYGELAIWAWLELILIGWSLYQASALSRGWTYGRRWKLAFLGLLCHLPQAVFHLIVLEGSLK